MSYSDIRALVDGTPIHYNLNHDDALIIDTEAIPEGNTGNSHTVELSYVASNEIHWQDGEDQLELWFGGQWPIEFLKVTIVIDPALAPGKARISAFTSVSATTTACACEITGEADLVSIATTRKLERGDELNIKVLLEPGHLGRTFAQRIRVFRQKHATAASVTLFAAGVFIYVVISFLVMRAFGSLLRFRLSARNGLVMAALLMSGLSLGALALVRRPEVAMPGILGGMLLSMLTGGSASHGPGTRFAWIPLAFLINALFYFVLGLLLRAVGIFRFERNRETRHV